MKAFLLSISSGIQFPEEVCGKHATRLLKKLKAISKVGRGKDRKRELTRVCNK